MRDSNSLTNDGNHGSPVAGGGGGGRWSTGRLITTFVFSFLMIFILRNMFTKDYTTETKSYLTKIGHADAIDRVIPKTTTDLINENKLKQQRFEQLITNVTTLQMQLKELSEEVADLKIQKGRKLRRR